MKLNESQAGETEEPTGASEDSREEVEENNGLNADPQRLAIQRLKIPAILLEGDQPTPEAPVTKGEEHASGPVSYSPAAQESGELPKAYGTGRLWLTARDPHCLYAHWDLTAEQEQQYRARAQSKELIVKVFLENRRERPVSEIQVPPGLSHSFVPVDAPGVDYIAELGYYQTERDWAPLSVSEVARVPAETVAEQIGTRFVTIPLQEPLAADLRQAEPEANLAPIPPRPVKDPLPEPQPVRADLPNLEASPVTAGDLVQLGPEKSKRKPVQSAETELQPVPGLERTQYEEQWTAEQEQALAKLIGWSLTGQMWAGSAEVAEVIRGWPEISSAQAAQLPAVPVTISSPLGGELPKAQGFWFNVNAELVIYGATEPGAQVTLGGRPVELRADGTFSFRFALPDGKYVLPATAYSAGGDIRRAELAFERSTRYYGEVGMHPQDPGLGAPIVENAS